MKRPALLIAIAPAFLIAVALSAPFGVHAETPVMVPPPAMDAPAPAAGLETAVLAGGCFWGVQAIYQHVKGVTNAVSGYAGGAQKDAEYETVSTGTTGHAESIKVTFDPKQISYGTILQIYFSVAHNPTELNYQGPDHGTQYRSEIFPQSDAQRAAAKAYIAQLNKAHAFDGPVVTKVDATTAAFFPAENYHQDYATLHPSQPYIMFNDAPKVVNLKKMFPDLWREKPVLVREASKTN